MGPPHIEILSYEHAWNKTRGCRILEHPEYELKMEGIISGMDVGNQAKKERV